MSEDKKLKDEILGEDLLDHNYDGIMELDNELPPWWLYMFYGTIIAAIMYSIAFFGMGKFNQMDEYAEEIETAAATKAIFDENFGGSSINASTAVLVTEEDKLVDVLYNKAIIYYSQKGSEFRYVLDEIEKKETIYLP